MSAADGRDERDRGDRRSDADRSGSAAEGHEDDVRPNPAHRGELAP
ncbi:unnamed protein product [Cylicostephanus goldi]|uniref:Uncharacterized protein n=1 Tax=Cylicostephanus goldi TaxID=71465 RepID=A0A3P6TKV4_CYLGO|nr:unnamed protein product [Cylicostephanus goldi]